MNIHKKLIKIEAIGCIVIIIGSFVFHYLYEWSNYNQFIGLFSATNESVFQHTKIAFVPYILYSIVAYFFVPIDFKRYVTAKSIVALSIYAFIITFFYTYTGIIGYHIAWVDITSMLVYLIIATWLSYKLITTKQEIEKLFYFVFPLFLLAFLSILVFTIYPPHIPLFYDILNKTYNAVKK